MANIKLYLLFLAKLIFQSLVTDAVPVKHNLMDRRKLFHGDVIRINSVTGKNAVVDIARRWPEGRIPYLLNDDISEYADDLISAMEHISEKTCVKFVPRTDEEDYLEMTTGGGWGGCHSYWGRRGGKQGLTLGYGCLSFGTVVHELMHAIGFEHEHNRSDRDEYIDILWDNIDEMYTGAFEKLSPEENRLLTPFDFDSIMMYGQHSFASQDGLFSMLAKDGTFLKEVEEKSGLSDYDVKKINLLYECGSYSV